MSPPEMPAWNLGLRFGLELAALAGLGATAWQLTEGVSRWGLTIGVPLVAAVAWGTFNVPGDPSRSGEAPIPVPGALRLALELCVLGGASAGLLWQGPQVLGAALAVLVGLHYATSLPRIRWLLAH